MYKTNIVATLSRKDIENFTKLCKRKGVSKRDLFHEALVKFQNQISREKHYEFKHQDVDRIKDSAYGIVIFKDTFKEVEKLNLKFDISRNRLLREIICEFLVNQT